MVETPFDQIKKLLSRYIPSGLICYLPDRWEKIGDILIFKLDWRLKKYEEEICRRYCEILGCRMVLNEVGGISGLFREPDVEIIYGSGVTETVHVENGVRFKLDPLKIMFSSGNMDERIRMAGISCRRETVVDLFAGIGYFTLPMAVYSKPRRIFACEINPVAYRYLCENIVLNHVTSIVQPILGDNRVVAPRGVADRVIMGYIDDTYRFLPVAFDCLKNQGGVIHYHDLCRDGLMPDKLFGNVKHVAGKYGREVLLLNSKHVKSYAPGVSHVVLDIEVGEK